MNYSYATTKQDPYTILGITNTSSPDDIKRAFRAKSLKLHPDKNPENAGEMRQKFQELKDAYDTLSDPQKRQQYDCQQQQQRQTPFMSFGMNNNHSNYYTGRNIDPNYIPFDVNDFIKPANNIPQRGVMISNYAPPAAPPQQPTQLDIDNFFMSMMQSMAGQQLQPRTPYIQQHQQQLQLEKPEPLIMPLEVSIYDVYNGAQIPVQIDRTIARQGYTQQEKETCYVEVFKGIDDGEIITLTNKGNIIADNCIGDVKLTVKVINTSDFKRRGIDLLYVKHISLKDALCGEFEFDLRLLDDNTCTLKNKRGSIIEPGSKKTYPNMGLTRGNQTGNLIIHFAVDFPTKLTETQIEQIKLLF